MAQDWDIKPRSDACSGCDAPFVADQALQSILVRGEEGYGRVDYCEACWTARQESLEAFSTWRSVYRLPPPKPEEVVKKETAESLLRRLIQQEDSERTDAIFILAVMLERKRLLAERDQRVQDDGRKVRVYEHRKTGESFVIIDPGLHLDELESVQAQVVVMLGGKVPEDIREAEIGDQKPEVGDNDVDEEDEDEEE